ncbi:uncharacterized protein H6S33_005597 [Morchella sextelata]|nr:uncharacterized protein H6S33_005597 [Morchella sextelata]KAH0613711.1 hypothetical protein H6S33_005597 [Morchella sextelata]
MPIQEAAPLPMAGRPAIIDTAKSTSVDSENGEIVSPPKYSVHRSCRCRF